MDRNNDFDKKPIVVLGASGRVGSVVANQLIDKGFQIRAFS